MKRKSIRKLVCCVTMAAALILCSADTVFASSGGEQTAAAQQASKNITPDEELQTISAQAYILTEMQTGKVLYEKDADKSIFSSHFNKLMTLLLLSEKIKNGSISVGDSFTATERANACNDPQIWLDKGEKITVDELIKSITVGNANDAAVTIAENISGNEESFVESMNKRSGALGMDHTVFKDPTGVNKANTTTPRDLSKLCAKLSKYEFLTPYLKTWLVKVRNAKAELVNSNRLVRNLPGITGMKACSSAENGSCGCVTVQSAGMKLCAVVVGCADSDKRDQDIKKLFKCGARSFQLYRPEIPGEMLENIPVTGGEKLECELEAENTPLVVIKRGTASQLEVRMSREQLIKAPVEKGQKYAEYTLCYEKDPVCTVDIVSKESIEVMNWWCGVKKLLYNLIKL